MNIEPVPQELKDFWDKFTQVQKEAQAHFDREQEKFLVEEKRIVDAIKASFWESIIASGVCFVAGVGAGYLLSIFIGNVFV